MTDTSSSSDVPSSLVCPLAKLGRLSPSVIRLPYASPHRHRYFKSASSESLDYISSSSNYNNLSEVICTNSDQNAKVNKYFPSYRYQEITQIESPTKNRCYAIKKQDNTALCSGNLKRYSPDRSSPYLDQGYHTLVQPSLLSWPVTSVNKYKKNQLKPNYIDRLPDDILLRIFSWLNASELCLISKVCRRWYNLAWDQSLWKTIILNGDQISGDKAIKSILRRLCIQDENASCPTVKQLFIHDGPKITSKSLTSLSRRCAGLTHVQLQNCVSLTDAAVSELVTRCRLIQHLDLTGCCQVSTVGITQTSDLSDKLILQYLDLTDCISVHDSSLRIILRNCPQLSYLYLRRCNRVTDAGVKNVPSFCSSLRELSVSDCHLVTDFALYELAKLGSNLRYLSVAKCSQVSDAGLKVIAKRCYKLRYLNVRGCEAVSDDALTAVARSCSRLRALDVGKCDVSDAGLRVLAENCPNLKKLSLRNCDAVTDRGIQYVCYYCRGLQHLNIQDCQISIEGYKAVKRFCKKCVIEHTNLGFYC